MNLVLLVIDSLRARSLGGGHGAPRTPFLERLGREAVHFRRAYATECWTLPTHASMFTGRLPSEHGAHFQTMAYADSRPALAERLAAGGLHTELVTRNSLFDGTVPGATRGFRTCTRIVADAQPLTLPFTTVLALAKPRVRRLVRASGFFSLLQKQNRHFVAELARLGLPADRPLLAHVLERMARLRAESRPYFLFANLYDVHAPYSPTPTSPLRSFGSVAGWRENLMLPAVLPRVSSHAYLRPGFHMSPGARAMLLGRYHRAIELMDAKLAAFYDEARRAGLLDDTLLVVTADHGEAFGEHGLYFHDASVYDTHLHVPLWIHHPEVPPAVVDDVVSTRELFALLLAVGLEGRTRGTVLDPGARAQRGAALAEHFHYAHTAGLLERYTRNVAAAVVGPRKMIVRREGFEHYDLARDPDERAPLGGTLEDFAAACRRDGAPPVAVAAALAHLRRWERRLAASHEG